MHWASRALRLPGLGATPRTLCSVRKGSTPARARQEEDEPSQSSSAGSAPGSQPQGSPPGPDGRASDSADPPEDRLRKLSRTAATAVIGGAVAVGSVPVVLGAVGFTGAGIAASSVAAKMMSAAAIANGGGVAAGGLVATLQSVGAAGLSMSSNVLLGLAGSSLGAWLGYSKRSPPSSPPGGPSPGAETGPRAAGDPPGPPNGQPPNGQPPNGEPPASPDCSQEDEE